MIWMKANKGPSNPLWIQFVWKTHGNSVLSIIIANCKYHFIGSICSPKAWEQWQFWRDMRKYQRQIMQKFQKNIEIECFGVKRLINFQKLFIRNQIYCWLFIKWISFPFYSSFLKNCPMFVLSSIYAIIIDCRWGSPTLQCVKVIFELRNFLNMALLIRLGLKNCDSLRLKMT